MDRWVDISFDCLPLRSVTRLDVPLDASPKFREFCEAVKAAIAKHGNHNTYFLHNARCVYRLTNKADWGCLEFRFQGTVLTDENDERCKTCDLDVQLVRETCEWLTTPIVDWFAETVSRSVVVEFDRYIDAGDLQQAKQRIEKIKQSATRQTGSWGCIYERLLVSGLK